MNFQIIFRQISEHFTLKIQIRLPHWVQSPSAPRALEVRRVRRSRPRAHLTREDQASLLAPVLNLALLDSKFYFSVVTHHTNRSLMNREN